MKRDAKPLRVGVIGVGTMGRHHIRIVSQTPNVALAGLYEIDPDRARHFCSEYGCDAFDSLDRLLDDVDAVTIAATTIAHAELGERCLERGVHVMMEKPLADSVENAKRLVECADRSGAILMVGHVERYNPAVRTLMDMLKSRKEEILTIDARRLAPFDGTRCLDVDVLYDLLIHDIDLVLEIAGSPVRAVSAGGSAVFSDKADFVHARLGFENSVQAALWAAKCSPKKTRALTVTTRSRYYEADTLAGALTVHTAEELPAGRAGVCLMGKIIEETIPLPPDEPLRVELEDFFAAIRDNRPPIVDGKRALAALEVLELVRSGMNRVT